MIRRAELEDVYAIYEMADRFNKEYFGIPLDADKALQTITLIVEEGHCFISDAGFIGGLVVYDLFRNWSILQEVGWYSEDKSGVKLLDRFIETGRELQVDEVRVCTLSTSSELAGRILHRKGFAPLETSYRLITGAQQCPQYLRSLPQQE